MKKITDKIFCAMKNKNIVVDEEVVKYGLEIISTKVLFAIIIVSIGILTKCFLESIIYTITFSLLRQYGGGYHAETKQKCFVLSVLMLICAIFIIKTAQSFDVFIILEVVITFLSVIYIITTAPIDTPNKRLDADELRIYGKRTGITVCILVIILGICLYIKAYRFSTAIMIGIIMEAYLMLKGQINNKRIEKGD
jgi:hypothetical protein